VLEFLHSFIVGIRLRRDAVGSNAIVVGPMPFGWRVLGDASWGYAVGDEPNPLTHASSSRLLPTGNVSVSWMIRSNGSSEAIESMEATRFVQLAHDQGRATTDLGTFSSYGSHPTLRPITSSRASSTANDDSRATLVVQVDVTTPGNLRTMVKVPLCKPGPGRVITTCPLGAPTYTDTPIPAAVFDMSGHTTCSFTGEWVC